jgi:hypothetical protein
MIGTKIEWNLVYASQVETVVSIACLAGGRSPPNVTFAVRKFTPIRRQKIPSPANSEPLQHVESQHLDSLDVALDRVRFLTDGFREGETRGIRPRWIRSLKTAHIQVLASLCQGRHVGAGYRCHG